MPRYIRYNHYIITDDDYASGIPPAVEATVLQTMTVGTRLTADQFPVAGARMWHKGGLEIGYTLTGATHPVVCRGRGPMVQCPGTSQIISERLCIVAHLSSMRNGDDFIIGSTHDSVCPGPRAFFAGDEWGVVLNFHGAYDSIPHEIGHVYELDDNVSMASQVEGYHVREDTNYSFTENPTVIVPLMRSGGAAPAGFWRWMASNEYEDVVDVMYPAAPPRPARTPEGGLFLNCVWFCEYNDAGD